jgi:hypothetical protein
VYSCTRTVRVQFRVYCTRVQLRVHVRDGFYKCGKKIAQVRSNRSPTCTCSCTLYCTIHRLFSTLDRISFQLTDEHFLYGLAKPVAAATRTRTCTGISRSILFRFYIRYRNRWERACPNRPAHCLRIAVRSPYRFIYCCRCLQTSRVGGRKKF